MPGHIAEPRQPRDVVNTEVGPVNGDERLAKVVERRLLALSDLLFDQHHPRAFSVLQFADGVDPLSPRRMPQAGSPVISTSAIK